MKRVLSLFMSIVMLISVTTILNLPVYADTSGDFEYVIEPNGCAVITGYNGKTTALTIPSQIDGYNVDSIGDDNYGFYGGFTELIISEGITKINDYAFSYNGDLVKVTFPNTLVEIGDSAFYSCNNLNNVLVPNSVQAIGTGAFNACSNLSNIKLSDNLTEISPWLFNSCYNLENIEIPENVKVIGDRAFSNTSIKEFDLPDSVVSLEGECFDYCDMLEKISFGKGLKDFDLLEFKFLSLKEYYVDPLNPYYSSIDGVLFDKDKKELLLYPSLKETISYIVPDSVETISNYVFSNCKYLEGIHIGKNVKWILLSNFNSNKLAEINVDKNNSDFISVNGVLYSKSMDELIYYPNAKLETEFTVPNSVEWIQETFNCVNLKKVNIYNNVKHIEALAFDGSIEQICYEGTEQDWNEIEFYINGNNYDSLLNSGLNILYGCNMPAISENEGSFKAGGTEYKGEFGYKYKDVFFDNKSTVYNHHLATMSLCLALSSYNANKNYDSDYTTENGPDKNVKDVLKGCGFDNYQQYNYDKKPTMDSIACAIASKEIDDYTLITVIVRSGGYDAEWASNVTVGLMGDHQGFDNAANQVYNYLADYVNNEKITGNVKFWITGFSRGGATSNLLAAKLNNAVGTHPLIKYNKQDVYAYTFATPAGAKSSNTPHSEQYNNIFNIIHYHDIVPLVAPSQIGWGFDRYGITKVLPSSETTKQTTSYESKMKKYLSEMGYQYEVDNFKNYINISNIPIVQDNNYDSLGSFNRKFIKSVAAQIGTREIYVVAHQTDLRSIMSKNGYAISSGLINEFLVSEQIFPLLLGEGVFHPHLFTTAIVNCNLLAQVHIEDANYVAWMQSMDNNYNPTAEPYFTNGDYRVTKINCPVDVYVYDENNKLVASIIDEIPQEIEGSSIISSIDENGQKVIYLPCDAEYKVEVIAREDCATTYTVNECTGVHSDIARVVTYEEVNMKANQTLTSTIDSYSDEEIENGAEVGTDLPYTTYLSDRKLDADLDVSGEKVSDYTYEVSIEYAENYEEERGTIFGGGIYTEGDFCQVTAENNDGYEFEGWYIDGVKASSDYQYRFAVKDNITIKAKYVVCEHEKYTFEVIKPTCTEQGYTSYVCTICGHTFNDTYTDTVPHTYNDGTITKAASCTETGIKTYTCTICGDSYTETISATGHSYNEWIVDKAPTNISEGSQYKKCKNCNDTIYEAISKLEYIADSKENIVEFKSDKVLKDDILEFAVYPSGADNVNPIKGDTRYVPVEWKFNNESKVFESTPYSAKINTNNLEIGEYSIEVVYVLQEFNGTEWIDTDEIITQLSVFFVVEKVEEPSTDTSNLADTGATAKQKNNSNDVTPKINTSKTSPKTGNTTIVPVTLGMAFVFVLTFITVKKKKSE